jgi:3-hydroxyisobutyrate dehydrogenase-like beta-hydroxyacid dehydrogenase
MAMVRRWAIYRVAEEHFMQVASQPSQGSAAAEALRLASATGAAHHVVEQIISRSAALEMQMRPRMMHQF